MYTKEIKNCLEENAPILLHVMKRVITVIITLPDEAYLVSCPDFISVFVNARWE